MFSDKLFLVFRVFFLFFIEIRSPLIMCLP
jgi:hypothetical protein